MVKDLLSLADRYRALGPRFGRAFDFARSTDFSALADGTYPVGGDDVRALVQRYTSKPAHEGRWEAHRAHIDLQMVVEGEEHIGVAPLARLTAEPYDADRDLLWLTGDGDRVTLRPGEFVLLWPEDGHMPGLAIAEPEPVLKVVFKIAV
ncbi:MAG: YhcH/YjgK/YiaL family protein [Acidobacteria bacterium]|nr:YhcH/YjgK/YiaL family protein [Acidobacteriota bacterium]